MEVFRARVANDSSWTSEQLPFVGREAELEQILAAAAGNPAVISVLGDAGIGKTALVRKFVDLSRRDGTLVYEGRCHETESAPYKGIDGVIDMLCNDLRNRSARELATLLPEREYHLPEMFPVLKRVGFLSRTQADELIDPHRRRAAAIAELRALLGRIGSERPVTIFVDDLQWAGPDTLQLLLELIKPPSPPLTLVVTARLSDNQNQDFVTGVAATPGIRALTLELAPLQANEVSELIAEHRAAFDTAAAWSESKGHPYLLSRMLAGSQTGGLTASLEGSIASLSADARSLLEVVALAARPLPQAAAFAAAKLGGWRADVIDELRRQRLVQTRGLSASADIGPYHDRVRETVLNSLDAEELRQRHHALAHYLEQHRRAAPHALAHHYQAAGNHDDALRWVLLAARDAVHALAFARADELYGRAVELSTGNDVELRTEWAQAMALAGRRARAAALYLDAAEAAAKGSSASAAAELRTRSGEESILAGHFQRGIKLIEGALRDAEVDFPSDNATTMAWALNIGATLSVQGLDFVERPAAEINRAALRRVDLLLTTARALALTDLRCAYIASLALQDALRLGELNRVQEALCHFVIGAAARAPDHPLFADAIERAQTLAGRVNTDLAHGWALTAEAALCSQAGDVGKAWPLLKEADLKFSRMDPPMLREAGSVRILKISCAAIEGVAPRFAVEVAADWLAEAESREDLFVANWLRIVGARVKLLAGDYDGALAQAAEAKAIWSHLDDDIFVSSCLHAEMFAHVYATPSEAHRRGREIEATLCQLFVSAVPIARVGFYLAYGSAIAAAGAMGTIGKPETVERIEGVIAELSLHRYGAPAIPALRSHLALLSGDRSAATSLMATSAQGWDEREQVLHAASTRLRHAQLCRDRARTDHYLEQLRNMGVGEPSRYATIIAGPAPLP